MASPTPLQAFSAVPKPSSQSQTSTITNGERMTGAQALVRSLEDLGVQDVFGIPGGAILPVYDAITSDVSFRFILNRHEQATGHAAEGYALATGRVGVCIVTSGPGATNMVTAIADANMDSVPLLVITGQGRRGGGVIRASIVEWLQSPGLRRVVSGFSSCSRAAQLACFRTSAYS